MVEQSWFHFAGSAQVVSGRAVAVCSPPGVTAFWSSPLHEGRATMNSVSPATTAWARLICVSWMGMERVDPTGFVRALARNGLAGATGVLSAGALGKTGPGAREGRRVRREGQKSR